MNFYQIKRKDFEVYPAILLDKIFARKTRKKIRNIFYYAMLITFFFVVVSLISNNENFVDKHLFEEISKMVYFFRSLFILLFSVWFTMYLFELMYLSYYFRDTKIDFDVLRIVNKSDSKDITKTFISDDIGQYVLARLGISPSEIKNFLKDRTDFVSESEYEIIENDDDRVSLSEFGYSLIHFDSDFSKLLKNKGITAKDFKEVLDWVSRINRRIKNQERWWTKERLSRIPSIGRNWAFGKIYHLQKFGHSIYDDNSYHYLGDKWRLFKDIVNQIESVLIKDTGSNIILISKETDFAMDAISSLSKEIVLGTVLPELEDKRVYVLDINILVSTYEEKSDFETMLQKILYQTAKAGNVILVIPNLSDFVENSKHLETDVKDILNEVISSSNVQIIATSNQRSFHEVLETDLDLMRNFEKINIEDFDVVSTMNMLEDEVQIIEAKENIFFTFKSIKAIIQSADRYFSESSLAEKTIDILNEITAHCLTNKKFIVTEEDVLETVEMKTGVPMGSLSKTEKRKLQDIEMLLKKKVVGQDFAIEGISEAMKRARLGVANPKRPLGSFLFIGPTGVGKTETSKSLAEVFFDSEEDMIRIDMTEFNDSSSVSRLIGDRFNSGILSSKIRDKQYGVLLLDEFEKAHPDVHNLFLQILDEGFFSDGIGERVNARNLIIIATSNAGSDLMYNAIDKNISLQSIKEKIISYLIDNKLFRPEFLNRFDEVVLFNPLSEKTLEVISVLMINKLNKRLEEKGIDVQNTTDLSKYLVSKGTNQKFGAREINRVIQKEIESKIANALISEEVKNGDTITFVQSGDDLIIKVI